MWILDKHYCSNLRELRELFIMEITQLLTKYIRDNKGRINDKYECLAISPDADYLPGCGNPYNLSFKIEFRDNVPFEWHRWTISRLIKDNKPDLEQINKLADRFICHLPNEN